MPIDGIRKTMETWFTTGDVAMLSDDVVFEDMGNHMGYKDGKEFKGPQAVYEWSMWLVTEPFGQAKPELVCMIVAEDHAVLEFTIVGKHEGEFAGVPATGKEVRVPVCITYDMNEQSKIRRGRIYVLVNTFLEQVGAKG